MKSRLFLSILAALFVSGSATRAFSAVSYKEANCHSTDGYVFELISYLPYHLAPLAEATTFSISVKGVYGDTAIPLDYFNNIQFGSSPANLSESLIFRKAGANLTIYEVDSKLDPYRRGHFEGVLRDGQSLDIELLCTVYRKI
jgi:hypothetical protein